MSDQEHKYTPTTEEVRHAFGEAFVGDGSYMDQEEVAKQNRAEFDRWLVQHDAEVRAVQREKDARISEAMERPEPKCCDMHAGQYEGQVYEAARIASAIRNQEGGK